MLSTRFFVQVYPYPMRLNLLLITLLFCVSALAAPAQAQTFSVLYAFHGTPDGQAPYNDLILDASGALYGVTFAGGTGYEGTAYKLTASEKEAVLYSFRAGYGNEPNALIEDSNGIFYGTTTYGGFFGQGEIFKLNQNGEEIVLYSFQGQPNGGVRPTGVIRDTAGNLYGTATNGGQASGCFGVGCGMVFRLDAGGKFTVLYTFTGGQDGGYPSGTIVRDAAGNLYGASAYGGDLSCFAPYGCGVVFKVDPSGKETVLHTFTGKDGDGANAWCGVVSDSDGNLYGSTLNGGTGPNCTSSENGCGTVYKIYKSGKDTILHSFTGRGADFPPVYASLALDAKGNILGTTPIGGNQSCGSGCGAIFMLDSLGKNTIVHEFTGGSQGANPESGVIIDSEGNIYGTAAIGGDLTCGLESAGCGIVYKLTSKGE